MSSLSKKNKNSFVCQSCGQVHSKWSGQCSGCLEWNTIVEETSSIGSIPKGLSRGKGNVIDLVKLDGESEHVTRYVSGISEFDRVTGGGLVPGSVTLICGDPGIGKSTLLLQIAAKYSGVDEMSSIYVSGEEAIDQVRLRAARLKVEKSSVKLASSINLRDIISTIESAKDKKKKFAIIDSIQTMYVDNIDAAPGSVSQVRAACQELIRLAKSNNIAIIIVGHVTKEGSIAGPRVLEHMVDSVLYFEGDGAHQFRILRSVKNRFGATDEIGVFEMTQLGLAEVPNPSSMFLSERKDGVSGSTVFAGIEGSRPMLMEIQSLVSQSHLATPRRAVIGWDSNRLAMILAVLESRCGISFSGYDIYLNVAGGIKINETAADLAVAASLISALYDISPPDLSIFFGEVSLSGEVRPVSQPELRIKEASKLGFEKAYTPKLKRKSKAKDGDDSKNNSANNENKMLNNIELESLAQLTTMFRKKAGLD